jgi:hypothetical protein
VRFTEVKLEQAFVQLYLSPTSWLQKSEELANFRFLINKKISLEELKKVGVGRKKWGVTEKERMTFMKIYKKTNSHSKTDGLLP